MPTKKQKSHLWECPKCGLKDYNKNPPIIEEIQNQRGKFKITSCPKCYCTIEQESI